MISSCHLFLWNQFIDFLLEVDEQAGASDKSAAHHIVGGLPYYKGGGSSYACIFGILYILIDIIFKFTRGQTGFERIFLQADETCVSKHIIRF